MMTAISGYLVAWGSPQRKSLNDLYFDRQTDFGMDFSKPVQLPIYYQHGKDATAQRAQIGTIYGLKTDRVGLSITRAELDTKSRFYAPVCKLLDEGFLGWSSGSKEGFVTKATQDGRILTWPLFEGSLAPNNSDEECLAWLQDARSLKSLTIPADLRVWHQTQLYARQAHYRASTPTQATVENPIADLSRKMDQVIALAEQKGLFRVDTPAPYVPPHSDPFLAYYKANGRSETVGGYLVVWGNYNDVDLQGEWFDRSTNLGLHTRYKAIPMLYQHGLDKRIGRAPIGEWTRWEADDIGLWVEGYYDTRHRYYDRFERLTHKGIFGLSSGTDFKQRDMNGKILTWLLAEGSVTPVPVEAKTKLVFLSKVG
jgi:hypothetical protein